MAFFVKAFQKGKWIDKSNSLLTNKGKVLALLSQLTRYFRKGGLAKVQHDLRMLGSYINDITHGRYKDYNGASLTLSVAAILYVVSPLDIVPDILPVGFLDDVAIVTWAVSCLNKELENYGLWRQKQPQVKDGFLLISDDEATADQDKA